MKKIHELITQETWRRSGHWDSHFPSRLDMIEWILRIYPAPNGADAYKSACVAVGQTGKGSDGSLAAWNYAPGRTFAQVIEAFRKADL